MFISVGFGYKQSKLLNINCQTAPLVDSINDQCYKEMQKLLKKREDFFNKEINSIKKKEAVLLKKLEKLEPPKEEKAPEPPAKDQKGKKA